MTTEITVERIEHNGASGANVITVPDTFADAYHIIDDGAGDVFFRIITTTGSEELVINDGGDDVNFRVEAVGVPNALFVQGSDGYWGINTNAPTLRVHGIFNTNGFETLMMQNTSAGNAAVSRFYVQSDTAGSFWIMHSSTFATAHLVNRAVWAADSVSTGLTIASTAGAGTIDFFTGGAHTIVGNRRMTIDASGHVYPDSVKAQDLGTEAAEWRTVHCQVVDTNCGRLVRSTRTCPVCATEMVRGAGTLVVGGEESDWALTFCSACGCAGMEELKHLSPEKLLERRPPSMIILEDADVQVDGRNRSVSVGFRYGEDVLDEKGDVIKKAVRNRTRLGEYELDEFFAMSDKDRLAFLLVLGRREWYSREETRLIQGEAELLKVAAKTKVSSWVGKDLLKETARVN